MFDGCAACVCIGMLIPYGWCLAHFIGVCTSCVITQKSISSRDSKLWPNTIFKSHNNYKYHLNVNRNNQSSFKKNRWKRIRALYHIVILMLNVKSHSVIILNKQTKLGLATYIVSNISAHGSRKCLFYSTKHTRKKFREIVLHTYSSHVWDRFS